MTARTRAMTARTVARIFLYLVYLYYCMALKQLDTLTKKQWSFVMDRLNGKPTKEQIELARKSVEQGKKIRTID